jgi:hypothetical protein
MFFDVWRFFVSVFPDEFLTFLIRGLKGGKAFFSGNTRFFGVDFLHRGFGEGVSYCGGMDIRSGYPLDSTNHNI